MKSLDNDFKLKTDSCFTPHKSQLMKSLYNTTIHDFMKSIDRDCEYTQLMKSPWTILLPTACEIFRKKLLFGY